MGRDRQVLHLLEDTYRSSPTLSASPPSSPQKEVEGLNHGDLTPAWMPNTVPWLRLRLLFAEEANTEKSTG